MAGHPNIIKLHEVLYDEPTGRLALVFELMDMNLYEAIKGRRHYLPDLKAASPLPLVNGKLRTGTVCNLYESRSPPSVCL